MRIQRHWMRLDGVMRVRRRVWGAGCRVDQREGYGSRLRSRKDPPGVGTARIGNSAGCEPPDLKLRAVSTILLSGFSRARPLSMRT